ncbi:hypothetical protein NADFUDRAFT_67070 [Nadsonia fulvescens var. elongata DSM 6958]|uniref:Protein kinase domain-containing protein n=1 Tax=Nadsonia fulvescens var. elongata DSM 6958 TaxID=857566 RepID=A0A1E3PG01_9ASCO|nr:hypothetical protein NADFUDRAFT_67070 [Nadsonia fulvescens var. elongata DSM 6958]
MFSAQVHSPIPHVKYKSTNSSRPSPSNSSTSSIASKASTLLPSFLDDKRSDNSESGASNRTIRKRANFGIGHEDTSGGLSKSSTPTSLPVGTSLNSQVRHGSKVMPAQSSSSSSSGKTRRSSSAIHLPSAVQEARTLTYQRKLIPKTNGYVKSASQSSADLNSQVPILTVSDENGFSSVLVDGETFGKPIRTIDGDNPDSKSTSKEKKLYEAVFMESDETLPSGTEVVDDEHCYKINSGDNSLFRLTRRSNFTDKKRIRRLLKTEDPSLNKEISLSKECNNLKTKVSEDVNSQLNISESELARKILGIQNTIKQLKELQKRAIKLVDHFKIDIEKSSVDFAQRLEQVKAHQESLSVLDSLEERLARAKETVDEYKLRLNNIREWVIVEEKNDLYNKQRRKMILKIVLMTVGNGGSSHGINNNNISEDVNGEDIVCSTPRQKLRRSTPALNNYSLGDRLGKGAFATVYRALNLSTGETVAVKQSNLADVRTSDLAAIMQEIDLLKNLHHSNIVKYHGFVKTEETFNIILEYCENGSLTSICKKFGKFPEPLVARYIRQVLQGLEYLHEQGVIHRDIKGANILTTKDGLVKLADFGVATKISSALGDASVVGTPNWMAPEIISLSGATTASDIWSVGCTAIELLTGKPPYNSMNPMGAMFAIVNDDHPPIPESVSKLTRDFLVQCFQKDPNLRISARQLLRHRWLQVRVDQSRERRNGSMKYDDAVRSVQIWNEAVRIPVPVSKNTLSPNEHSDGSSVSPVKIKRLQYQTSDSDLKTKSDKPVVINDLTRYMEKSSKPRKMGSDRSFAQEERSGCNIIRNQEPLRSFEDEFWLDSSGDKLSINSSVMNTHPVESWDDDFSGDLNIFSDKSSKYCKVIASRADSKRNLSKKRNKINQSVRPTLSAVTIGAAPVSRRSSKSSLEEGDQSLDPNDYSQDFIGDLDTSKINDLLKGKRLTPRKKMSMKKHDSLSNIEFPVSEHEAETETETDKNQSTFVTYSQYSSVKGYSRSDAFELSKYVENEDDGDYTNIFDETEKLSLSLVNTSSHKNSDEEDDDPFIKLDEYEDDDIQSNIARDKLANAQSRMATYVNVLNSNVKGSELRETSELILTTLTQFPETRSTVVKSHGILPILEVLESTNDKNLAFILLQIINEILGQTGDSHTMQSILENFCFVGGIPIVSSFASKQLSEKTRMQAALFVNQICSSPQPLPLQMFVSCGGLFIIAGFIEEDFETLRDLVLIGIDAIARILESQSSTLRNDFCRILSNRSILESLVSVLCVLEAEKTTASNDDFLCVTKIISILGVFAQTDPYVKQAVATRNLFKLLFRSYGKLQLSEKLNVLKFFKSISMVPGTLSILQNANAIDFLVEALAKEADTENFKDFGNQIFQVLYNLCRLSDDRQEETAMAGIVPLLQKVAMSDLPIKEFALPILCDFAHSSSRNCRKELWRYGGLKTYLHLLSDQYWQVNGFDAITAWLHDETTRVEEDLLEKASLEKIRQLFVSAKAHAFEGLLDYFDRMFRLSPAIAKAMTKSDIFDQLKRKLSSINKPIIRLTLLKVIRSIISANDNDGSILKRFGIWQTIKTMSEIENSVLVKGIASELLQLRDVPVNSNTEPSDIGDSGSKKTALFQKPDYQLGIDTSVHSIGRNSSLRYGDSRRSSLKSPTAPSFSPTALKPRAHVRRNTSGDEQSLREVKNSIPEVESRLSSPIFPVNYDLSEHANHHRQVRIRASASSPTPISSSRRANNSNISFEGPSPSPYRSRIPSSAKVEGQDSLGSLINHNQLSASNISPRISPRKSSEVFTGGIENVSPSKSYFSTRAK